MTLSKRLAPALLACLLLGAAGCSTRGTLGIDSTPGPGLSCDGTTPVGPLQLMALTNAEDCDVLSYPLAFLSGETDVSEGEVVVELGDTRRAWPIHASRFKALAKLARGENQLRFEIAGQIREIRLVYEPPLAAEKVVRLFVYLGSDGTGQLDAPPGIATELTDALARVRLDGLLWQTFFAEGFRRSRQRQSGASVPRRTFALELDTDDEPIVHVLRHDTMTQAELWQRNAGLDDWGDAVRLVNQQTEWPVADSLHIGFSLVSHVEPTTGEVRAQVCAGNGDPGGGGVGLCGGSNLITHAASLDEVVARFSDATATDPMYVAEDSQLRGTHWAAYATTLGCALAEGLRGLGLPYAPSGLFAPDCGHLNRFFMPYEPGRDGSRMAISPDVETGQAGSDWFHPESMSELETSPFIRY